MNGARVCEDKMSPVHAHHPFRHEAVMYAGVDEFVGGTSAFVRDGRAAGEPTLVVVGRRKLDLVREDLGADADGVLFADMAEVGANPARIIPAWRAFVDEHAGAGRAVRGIGEPIYPERGAAELAECHRHESLLNVAFADTPGFWLMCPYDTAALAPEVVETARRTHPHVMDHGVSAPSPTFHGLDKAGRPHEEPLPAPPPYAEAVDVELGALAVARHAVRRHAAAVGLAADRARDLLVAVNEIATNSVRHGGGRGRLLIWPEAGELVCEVRDDGRIEAPLAGRERPEALQVGGYGLWLANQLCDLVQVRTHPSGGVVRLRMRVG
jgi:anti-sigma regulatory factor (Ser/Thr protein kinase)